MNRPAARLLQGLTLLLAVGYCSLPRAQTAASSGAAESFEKRIKAIQIEAQRIDDAYDAPETPERRRLTKDLPHWQFSGLFEKSIPVFLEAQFTEGEVVRVESYYFVGGKPVLIRIQRWWDVDDPRKAPEPTTKQDFYIENDQTIRHTIKVESRHPVTRTDDAPRPAVGLADRAHAITKILLRGDTAGTDSLRTFPEAEQLKP